MKSFLKSGIPAIVCCLSSSASAQSNEFTVMPGHSLGRAWLGATHSTVRKIWGRPFLIQRQGSYTVEFWRIKNEVNHYKCATFRNKRVIQMETDSPRFVTPHGISVNSNLAYVRRILGRMRVVSVGLDAPDPNVAQHAAHYYDSVRRGLAFELDLGFRPDTSAHKTPHALHVHRRGYRFVFINGREVWAENSSK